ncbi:MAG: class I SAM-dependent methyltransferase [Actinomycetota bacterium]|nr:class I SAM-dependent methyltransferase [Actinomycetota bacterium]
MTTTTEMTVDTTLDDERRDALVERLFGSLLGGMELLSIDLGRRLGLYATLSESGAQTAAGFARRAGIAERYAREWLEQQAVAGILDVEDPDRTPAERRYTLPAVHADVLLHAEHPANLMGAAPSLTGLALTLSAVAEAYRTGTGVSYADFGADIRHGIGAFNRPMFVGELAGTWLAALPEVRDRLAQGGCVLDVGCGTGWSSIALARAFPQTTVVAIDLDEASIADARDNAERAGVADRVTFEVHNAATYHPAGAERYDLACMFEALHDMGEPVAALRRIRAALAPGAPVLIADERVAERFTAPADEVERFMYGWSVLHCLPATIDESDAVANGTVLREGTVGDWARQAGFRHVQTLPIDNDFWRFYRLDA